MAQEASYQPEKFEAEWAARWEKEGLYQTPKRGQGQKAYILGMFPYPSGEGLHTGHARIFTACDVIARYRRMKGEEVLLPMGWDGFGLPAENAAIKAKKNPMEMVPANEANFKRQMQALGWSYDWEREFSTTDPAYYRWTQWLFLKLYSIKNGKGERLIYRQEVPINWCPKCKTGLANEEVLPDGTHERCGTPVTERLLPQWLMRITGYADRLLYNLSGLDWPRGILEMQRNWIGRKEGVRVRFAVEGDKLSVREIEVFTTRLETIFGVSFLAVAPEIVRAWTDGGWKAGGEVNEYIEKALSKTEQQRSAEAGEKTGVATGIAVINPASGEKVPVWVADYVLKEVGTGAVMGVPAHDERDRQFAQKMGLPMGPGELRDKEVVLEKLKALGTAEEAVSYHLRDWIFSRQRYWGEPFPLVYCSKCGDENGVVPLPEDQLPLKLPLLASYEPTDTGESPLARAKEWVETVCPQCGGPARRETDTMPNWAGSCWYFLRFVDPKNDQEAWSKEAVRNWLPVDWYLGGAEHAVLHLLYARFWVKALFDLKLLPFDEPFVRLRSVGMVLAEDGRKMSKSLGNVVNPDEVIEKFGADAVRLYELFMGPWDQAIAWETRSLVGCRRFLEKVWRLASRQPAAGSDQGLAEELDRLIKKVGEDIEALKFNTAVAALMKFVNLWSRSQEGLSSQEIRRFLLILAPLAPFMTEELWQRIGASGSIHKEKWPRIASHAASPDEKVTIVVQVNGKVRATIVVSRQKSVDREAIEKLATADEQVKKWLMGEYEVVFVPGKLINFVLK